MMVAAPAPPGSVQPDKGSAPRAAQAAREFEAIFVRQMLRALEKTASVTGSSNRVAGQQAYQSLVVEALSDAIAAAGGIGLADLVTRSLSGREGEKLANSQG